MLNFLTFPLFYAINIGEYKDNHLEDKTSVKVNLSHDRSGNHRRGRNVGLPSLTFGTTSTTDLLAVRSGHNLPRRKFLGSRFC
jgi:hypothetical protein